MRQWATGIMVGLACAVAAGSAFASQVAENRMVSVGTLGTCAVPSAAAASDPLADRAEVLAQYEALPQPCLRAIVVVCNRAAEGGLLDVGQAAACSIGHEALLKRGFAGDFQALMGWWQRQRRAPGLVTN